MVIASLGVSVLIASVARRVDDRPVKGASSCKFERWFVEVQALA
jgi:hypothetical protein